ncbi:MAG: choice-of-anchor D domain-containing protein [Candidatus Eisenbacteria bacterium]|nr:choice-of-anchor D domain-containing protein [Candidatus Eisenbacteria bacterium]
MSARRCGPAIVAPAAAWVVVLLAAAQPAWGFRVVSYNLLDYDPGERQASFRTVMDSLDADIIAVQEIKSQSGVNDFLNNVLNYAVPGKYQAMLFYNGPDTDNACFFKVGVVDSISAVPIFTPVRYTIEYTFRPSGYASSAAQFRILSTHLKAGDTPSDETTRRTQTDVIRDYLNGLPSGSHFMVLGDLNVYSNVDQGYVRLIRSEADNDGRCKDPINKQGTWHDNYTFRHTHTQSPRDVSFGGGSGGGLDDRFDQILVSYAFDDGDGLSYVPSSYFAFGNDGYHLNAAINAPPNYVVSQAVADALYYASDHIPVVASFQAPAKVAAASELDFGAWIVGTTAERTLAVGNGAVGDADELSYSLTAPSGFSAPGGTFLAAGGASNDHTISMDAGSAGSRSGTLVVNSNDLDHPAWNVSLSGSVVEHAVPSLDASETVLVDTLDFGSHEAGEFGELALDVHNLGHGPLQALLEVYDHVLVGGDGRFSIVGGFVTKEAGASPASYAVAFDADGADENALYTAVLTLKTRDDADVSGGTNLADLVVHLSAFVLGGSGVPDDAAAVLALGPVRPNPAAGGVALALTLPEAADASVDVVDVAGRVVRALRAGPLSAGVHEIAWDGRDDRGAPVASGVYFCRATVGEWREARKVVLVR